MRKALIVALGLLWLVSPATSADEVRIKTLGTVRDGGHQVTLKLVTSSDGRKLLLEGRDSGSDVTSDIHLKKAQVVELRKLMQAGYSRRHGVPPDETWIPGDVTSGNSRAWIEVFKGNAFIGISEGRLTRYLKLTPSSYSKLDRLLWQGASRL